MTDLVESDDDEEVVGNDCITCLQYGESIGCCIPSLGGGEAGSGCTGEAGSGCTGLYSGARGSREQYLIDSMSYSGDEAAQFMAQCAHECDGFNTMEEYASGDAYEGRKDLGNLNPGDGRRYKGRGFIQITGRHNYRTYGEHIAQDLENNPTLAADPAIAAQVAVEYWNRAVRPHVSDFSDTHAATKRVNGGYNGIEDRIDKFNAYREQCR